MLPLGAPDRAAEVPPRDRSLVVAVRRAAFGQRLRATALASPLILLVFFAFFIPIMALLTRAVYNPTIGNGLPETARALDNWNANQSVREIDDQLRRVWKTGEAEHAARHDFVNLDDAWKPLSGNRRAIMHAMAGAGALSIREIARRVRRDVRAVQSDVRLLHHPGVIDRTEDGRMTLPYKTIKFDFTIEARQAA